MGKAIGVDLGATGIKVAVADRPGRDGISKVTRIGRRSLEDGDITAGRIKASKKVTAALSAALSDIKAPKKAPLVVSVGGDDVALRWISVPHGFKPTEWRDHIRHAKELSELSPTLLMKDAAISVVPIRPEPQGYLVAVAGINRAVRDQIVKIGEALNRQVQIIEPSAASLLRAMARPTVRDVAVLVDIGHSQTIVAGREGPDLRWVDCLQSGGHAITGALAQECQLSNEEAEAEKKVLFARDVDDDAFGKYSAREQAQAFLDDDDDPDLWGRPDLRDLDPDQVAEQESRDRTRVLTHAVDNLLDGIAETIERRTRSGYLPPAGVVLTGRGAMVKGINQRLEDRLGITVHAGLPQASIPVNNFSRPFAQRDPSKGKNGFVIPNATEREFAVAIGAAQHQQVA